MLRYQNHFYRVAITRKDLDAVLQLTDEQIAAMERADFLETFYTMVKEALTLSQKVKDIEAMATRLKDQRFLDIAEVFGDAVMNYKDVVLRISEAKPSTPYSKILKELVKQRPELQEMVQQITEAEMAQLSPSKRLLKYREKDEPQSWKKVPHEPLASTKRADVSFYELTETGMWQDAVEEMLLDYTERLNQFADELELSLAA
jgi:hypothetical protein